MAGPQLDDGVDALIEGAAAQYNVDPNLIRAVIQEESGGNPFIHDSSAGAKGIAQFKLATLQKMMGPDANPYDVPTAIAGAAKYLAEGLSKAEALGVPDPGVYAARYYNGGPGGPGNPATEVYARQVAQRYAAFSAANPAPSAAGDGAADGAAPSPPAPTAPPAPASAPVPTPTPSNPPALNLPQVPTADLGLNLDLHPLARLGLLSPEEAMAATR